MREILFKAKRVDNGEWVEGYYIKATHHWHEHGKHEDWIVIDTIQNGGWCNVRGKYAIIPETLCEFTGLCDKNGNRIFEGDIISFGLVKCVVKYNVENGRYMLYEKGIYKRDGFNIDTMQLKDVIGNIHDNPELLTAER